MPDAIKRSNAEAMVLSEYGFRQLSPRKARHKAL
jgi:hypothetical protein